MPRPKKIMVVDDEAGIRNLLFEVLSEKGFHVTLAKDGQDSLTQMGKGRFDLLITDINMPRLDGIELLRRMKRAGREERVIVMTGEPMDKIRLIKDVPVVHAHLTKPFHMNKLLEAVSSALAPKIKKIRPPIRSGGRRKKAVNVA